MKGAAYSIPGVTVDGNDVMAVYSAVITARERAVNGEGPTLVESKTYRMVGHWIGDPIRYRTREEEAQWKEKCPIKRFSKYLSSEGILTVEEIKKLEEDVKQTVEDAEKFAVESPDPDPDEVMEDIYS